MKTTLYYTQLPPKASLQIALRNLKPPFSIEIRQARPGAQDWVEYIDADSVEDLYGFLADELSTCSPFFLDIEEVTVTQPPA